MNFAIALTLLLAAAAMGRLFVLNLRLRLAHGRPRHRDAMIVSAIIGLWCVLAAVWILSQGR